MAPGSGLLPGHLSVGPVLDAEASPFFRISDPRCLEWVLCLIQARRLRSVLLAPPGGAFSPARPGRPMPRGRESRRALFACLAVMLVAVRCGVPALLLQPLWSRARGLAPWQRLLSSFGHLELFFGGCDAFSAGKGMVVGLASPALVEAAPELCQLTGKGVRATAPVVASCFGTLLSRHAEQLPPASGLEGLLLNDVMTAGGWRTDSSWAWRDRSHINVLEARSFLRALRLRAPAKDDMRFVHGLDSNVALGALVKGRTSSRLLLPAVKQSAALQVGFGLYPGPLFCPTRLNVSDAPTRDRPLPAPAQRSLFSSTCSRDLYALAALGGLSRPSAGWLRLGLLLVSSSSPPDGSALLRALTLRFRDCPPGPARPPGPDPWCPLGFDSTLGYPGEGPSGSEPPRLFLVPRDGKDRQRAAAREGTHLGDGRPVLERTTKNRAYLLGLFAQWLGQAGLTLEELLDPKKADTEVLNAWVVNYGRQLFESGRPYWHYSETINGLAARRPSLKRSLQAAWDLAYSWMALEPSTHHVAMPPVILLSMLTVCLCWGWTREAGLFALAWGGLLRIGEALAMIRAKLVLPEDVLFSQRHILARIEEPKTRMRMARHQAARVEQVDLVQLIGLVFGPLEPHAKLWPHCAQTLRRRFDLILERLNIARARPGHRPLDLGSFRPGGATHLLSITDNSELVRRRGRWASHRVMEIYIQEVTACTFYPSLPLATRQLVLELAQAFPATLAQATEWSRLGLPPASWYGLFSAG